MPQTRKLFPSFLFICALTAQADQHFAHGDSKGREEGSPPDSRVELVYFAFTEGLEGPYWVAGRCAYTFGEDMSTLSVQSLDSSQIQVSTVEWNNLDRSLDLQEDLPFIKSASHQTNDDKALLVLAFPSKELIVRLEGLGNSDVQASVLYILDTNRPWTDSYVGDALMGEGDTIYFIKVDIFQPPAPFRYFGIKVNISRRLFVLSGKSDRPCILADGLLADQIGRIGPCKAVVIDEEGLRQVDLQDKSTSNILKLDAVRRKGLLATSKSFTLASVFRDDEWTVLLSDATSASELVSIRDGRARVIGRMASYVPLRKVCLSNIMLWAFNFEQQTRELAIIDSNGAMTSVPWSHNKGSIIGIDCAPSDNIYVIYMGLQIPGSE